MSNIVLEGDFPEERKRALEEALSSLVISDCTLLFEVSFVPEEEIQRLNRIFRAVDSVTDVLSFPSYEGIKGKKLLKAEYESDFDEEGRLPVGSIALCTARARAQAEEYGHSFERECTYLTVHGVLHCLGYDHEKEEDKREMREKEECVMNALQLTRD